MSTTSTDPRIETLALQTALAADHAALYGIGVAGGHLSGTPFQDSRALYQVHLTRRDNWIARLVELKAKPVAAAAAYQLPVTVTNRSTATALIRLIELRVQQSYGLLVQDTSDADTRKRAVTALLAAAGAYQQWGGAPQATPGD